MSGFSPEWLALREPADVAARSARVTRHVLDRLAHHARPTIVDLGCGTGSNVRYLATRVRSARWRLIDHDEALLEVARGQLGADAELQVANLVSLPHEAFAGADLVTASALLDLVSESWLHGFVEQCRESGAAVLAALNYDGRMECHPAEPEDRLVRDLVNRHQRTDKGFGPALGPDSGARAAALLGDAGYDVTVERSDWVLDIAAAELQHQLIDGWAHAAIELEPSRSGAIRDWAVRRHAHVAAGHSHIVVGHDDVGAVLAG